MCTEYNHDTQPSKKLFLIRLNIFCISSSDIISKGINISTFLKKKRKRLGIKKEPMPYFSHPHTLKIIRHSQPRTAYAVFIRATPYYVLMPVDSILA